MPKLGTRVQLKFDHTADFSDGDIALVQLESFRIFDLISKDLLSGTGGALTFRFGGQESTLGWEVDRSKPPVNGAWVLKNSGQYSHQLLFLGKPEPMAVDVFLLESDDDLAKRLEQIAGALSAASSAAKYLPTAGGVVAGGIGVVNALVSGAKANLGQEVELQFHGALGRSVPFGRGTYTLSRWSGDQAHPRTEVELKFSSLRVAPDPTMTGKKLAVILETVEVYPSFDSHPRGKKFLLELAVGSGANPAKFSLSVPLDGLTDPQILERVVGIQDRLLFLGAADPAIPFTASAAVANGSDLSFLEKLVESGTDTVVALTDDETLQERIKKAGKAAESLRSLAMELLPGQQSFGKTSGAFLPTTLEDLPPNLVPVGGAVKRHTIAWTSEVGTVRVFLRVEPA